VTALYEIVPKGEKGWLEPLRYGKSAADVSVNTGELAMLRVRYQLPEGGNSRLIERPIVDVSKAKASDDLRFAAAVAAFSQQLKDGRYTGEFSLKDTEALARGARGDDRFGLRAEFVQLVELAQSLRISTASNQQPNDPRIE
jgi:Ca-activated chloride channel family protein